ncbi:MAG: methionyl-tRNA formyltransferase [Planctomycetota bacterium]
MRVVFLGSPPFATPVLQSLLDSRHEVIALVTRPDRPLGRGLAVRASPLVELARSRDLRVLQPETTKDPAFVAELRKLSPDVLLVASYGEILRREMLELAPQGALNVHASLLPRHRGASPIQAAILAGDAETGVAVQKMVLALDEGDVLYKAWTPIGARENAGALLERLSVLGGEAAVTSLDLLERGDARFRPQDPSAATYARRMKKEEGRIDWSKSPVEIDRHVRAMTPWPGARTVAPNGREIVVLELRAAPRGEHAPADPGTVLATDPELEIACGGGAVAILSVKPSGGVAMDAAAWLRGARIEPGARFTS